MCNALVSSISWVVTVPGTISTVAPAIVQTGSLRMSTFCRRWSASVRPPATPPAASGCSRARATVANLEVCSIRVAGKTDLLIDITLGHDFICAGRSGRTQGWLRNPDNPDRILENAASDNIRTYREPYQRNRQVAFLQACMSTSGRIHGEFLRLLFFLSHKQADDYFAPLGYEAHKEEFCHHRGVFFRPQQVHHWAGVRPGCIAPWCPNLRPSLHLPVPRRAGVW
jgi:hypothetical protein